MSRRRIRDLVGIYHNVPNLLGMDLKLRKNIWEGRYYLDGRQHPYKRDKLKVKIYNVGNGNDIWLFEQGRPGGMSLATWLVNYGGASDYRSAYRMMENKDVPNRVLLNECRSVEAEKVYVDLDEYLDYRKYDRTLCPLYQWFVGLFGKDEADLVWNDYGVTTDERGLAVFWYIDADSRICYDKRMKYGYDGHRDKTFGGTRKYRVAEGYTARPMFGSLLLSPKIENLPSAVRSDGILPQNDRLIPPTIKNALKSQKKCLVESEKTCLLARAYFGGVWMATGGKTNLRGIEDDIVLFPDMDAISEWSERGEVCEWWNDAAELGFDVGTHCDIGDLVVYLRRKELDAECASCNHAGKNEPKITL